jgi:hypothetical protein
MQHMEALFVNGWSLTRVVEMTGYQIWNIGMLPIMGSNITLWHGSTDASPLEDPKSLLLHGSIAESKCTVFKGKKAASHPHFGGNEQPFAPQKKRSGFLLE